MTHSPLFAIRVQHACRATLQLDGVDLVQTNSFTGSVLIHYAVEKVDQRCLFTSMQRIFREFGIGTTATDLHFSGTRSASSNYPAKSELVDKVVDQLVEKCIERAALMLLGALH